MDNFFPTHPKKVPYPSRLLLFAPHPDDICISAGGLAAIAGQAGIDTKMILVTDGSESVIPEQVLQKFGWNDGWHPERTRNLRGRIRVGEANEEASRLGLNPLSVRLLQHQSWHTNHQTPSRAMNADLSIRIVNEYRPAPIDHYAVSEVRELLNESANECLILAFPDPYDNLCMHRTATALIAMALLAEPDGANASRHLLLYRCLSSVKERAYGERVVVEFGEDIMQRKVHAIQAHESMRERRRLFGGYGSRSSEFYDTIVQRWDVEIANRYSLSSPYAEEYGLVECPLKDLLQQIINAALEEYEEV
jgi:LmbE family N-acetylglucosaminyl deacetylase